MSPPAQPRLWRHPEFVQGSKDMAGIALGIAAWGLVTGVAMVNGGLGVGLALLMSLIVFAGSAQLATIALIAAGAPLWVVWATAVCVNLRFVIFSAAWRPYVRHRSRWDRLRVAYFSADLSTVLFMRRYPQPEPAPGQWEYFWGGALTNWLSWHTASLVGITLSGSIPPEWGLSFAGTLALLGLTCSLLAGPSTWMAAVVASGAAIAAYALPLRLNIVVAIAAAVAMAIVMDTAARALKPAASSS